MNIDSESQKIDDKPVLVIGGSGKTGRRVAERLAARGHSVRIGSRSRVPSFDWGRGASWDAILEGVEAVYVAYAPDLAIPGATDAIDAFARRAKSKGVERLVLLSGRGEAEAQASERVVQQSGLEWTIIRASWFNQNFSEGSFLPMVQAGRIALPAGDALEPFVDADDIAEIAAQALIDRRHAGQLYEVTGPHLMTFAEAADLISSATGRKIEYVNVPHNNFIAEVEASNAPRDVVWILDYLFTTVLDGRNAAICDGVPRALGRPAKSFADYARETAATGVWRAAT
ncbi:MAG: NAD(P)H-binding protein [Parvularculaceae bacterium]